MSWRDSIPSSLAVVAIALAFGLRDFTGPMVLVMVGALAGLAFAPSVAPGRRIWIPVATLLAFSLLAIPGSSLWGHGNLVATVSIAIPTLPFALLVFRRTPSAVKWLVLLGLAHAAIVLAQGVLGDGLRAEGLTTNPNPAAGALVVLAAYLLPSGGWAVLPLAALPFTGSRWASMCMAALLAGGLVTRSFPWRRTLAVLGIVAVVWVLAWPRVYAAYRLGIPAPVEDVYQAGLSRWHVPDPPGLPPGFSWFGVGTVTVSTMHNVPQRLAVETSVFALAAWLFLVAQGLLRRPWFDGTWWALASLALLSDMEYYTWSGQLAALWWLVVAQRGRDEYHAAAAWPILGS